MKKPISIFILILFTISFYYIVYSDEKKIINSYSEHTVFETIIPETKKRKDLLISNINLSKYDYMSIDSYVITADDTLLILGVSESGIRKFSSISCNNLKEIIIAEYPVKKITNIQFNVFFMGKIDNSSHFIVLKYFEKNFKNITDKSLLFLDIFRFEEKKTYKLLRHEKIEYYSELEILKEPVVYFICDANNDDYTDILLWKKENLLIDERKKNDQISNRGEMYALLFQKEEMTFSGLIPLKSLNYNN